MPSSPLNLTLAAGGLLLTVIVLTGGDQAVTRPKTNRPLIVAPPTTPVAPPATSTELREMLKLMPDTFEKRPLRVSKVDSGGSRAFLALSVDSAPALPPNVEISVFAVPQGYWGSSFKPSSDPVNDAAPNTVTKIYEFKGDGQFTPANGTRLHTRYFQNGQLLELILQQTRGGTSAATGLNGGVLSVRIDVLDRERRIWYFANEAINFTKSEIHNYTP